MMSSNIRMTHGRSASWSPQRELLESLGGEPLRSVLREYMPAGVIDPPQHSESGNSPNSTHVNVEHDEEEPSSSSYLDFAVCLAFMKKVLPFAILLSLRWAWERRIGLCVLIGLFGAFVHSNNTIKRQVSLRDKRHVSSIVGNMVFIAINVHIVYYVFHEQELYKCLYFSQPNLENNIWNVIWAVGITDFMIRFLVMFVKSGCVLQYKCLIPYKSRGKWYMLLEHVSQFYRILVPTTRWTEFFLTDTQGLMMGLLLCGIYAFIKLFQVFSKGTEVLQAVRFFVRDQYYGSVISVSELSDVQCPICQEDMESPLKLHCKHVFCEECITSWFDRHPTCPMCRARITTTLPVWRDGSTSAFVQFF